MKSKHKQRETTKKKITFSTATHSREPPTHIDITKPVVYSYDTNKSQLLNKSYIYIYIWKHCHIYSNCF